MKEVAIRQTTTMQNKMTIMIPIAVMKAKRRGISAGNGPVFAANASGVNLSKGGGGSIEVDDDIITSDLQGTSLINSVDVCGRVKKVVSEIESPLVVGNRFGEIVVEAILVEGAAKATGEGFEHNGKKLGMKEGYTISLNSAGLISTQVVIDSLAVG
ncbi:hypothetical protein ACOSQ2_031103 [Xanthoceras sorbifolium]